MYHYLVGVSIFKSFTPYFRKHVFDTLTSEEFLFMNTLFISVLVSIYFFYRLHYKNRGNLGAVLNNYRNLSTTQLLSIIFISSVAVLSSIFIFEFDRNFNTPMINSIYMETLTTMCLLLVAVFLFEEKYSLVQISGVFLVMLGAYLLSKKEK